VSRSPFVLLKEGKKDSQKPAREIACFCGCSDSPMSRSMVKHERCLLNEFVAVVVVKVDIFFVVGIIG
jgi:hypothetical protein